MRITRNRAHRTTAVDQEHYIKELTANVRGRSSILANGYANFTKCETSEADTDEGAYQTLLGKLNWLVRATRTDIAFVTQRLSQFAHGPSARDLGGAQYAQMYLDQTAGYRIEFSAAGQRA